MRELYDFRIEEKHAQRYLKPEDGKVLGETVRRLVLDSTDSRMELIRKLQHRGLLGGNLERLGKVVILAGPNGSGKSRYLQRHSAPGVRMRRSAGGPA